MADTKETTAPPDADETQWRSRAHANLARMRTLKVTAHEMNHIVGLLAGCHAMDLALDAIEEDRAVEVARRERERGPIEGQTVIELPARRPAA